MSQNVIPTKLVVVLDESYSMKSHQKTTLNGFNEFISSQRELGNCQLTLYIFSEEVRKLPTQEIEDVSDLTSETFKPHGRTALFDAMGEALREFPEDTVAKKDPQFEDAEETSSNWEVVDESEIPEKKKILLVITDGEENASTKETSASIKALCDKRKNVNIVYLGSNQDAILAAKSIGGGGGSALNYSDGNKEVYRSLSAAVMRTRTGQQQEVVFTQEERLSSI